MNILEINNLSFSYLPAKSLSQSKKVLDNLSFRVAEGEIFGLLGPNGSGKTTLYRILSTSMHYNHGSVLIFQKELKNNLSQIKAELGVVFQNPSLDKKLTVLENLLHHGHLYGMCGSELSDKIQYNLKRFGLNARQHDFVETLSGGLARRVEIAKSLLHSPKFLLMDEPSTGLDPGARRELWDYLRELKSSGITILLTTHLMDEGEKCDRVGILHEGSLRCIGFPNELIAQLGGEVINIESDSPDELCKAINEKFNVSGTVVNHKVRIEKSDGHKFIPQLVEAFPKLISSVKVGKPSLDDVFVHETGVVFYREDER